jgi:hypothetical protein
LLFSVDLSTFFFLCKIWAEDALALTSTSAHNITRSGIRLNPHLSSLISHRALPGVTPGRDVPELRTRTL